MSYYDILLAKQLSGGGGDITVESLSVTANGTYTAPSGKAYSPVVANVPNSYTASDEGKVVSSGALVAQTSQTIDTNGTYDTTLKNSVTVNVSGGGGGASNIVMGTFTTSTDAGSHEATISYSGSGEPREIFVWPATGMYSTSSPWTQAMSQNAIGLYTWIKNSQNTSMASNPYGFIVTLYKKNATSTSTLNFNNQNSSSPKDTAATASYAKCVVIDSGWKKLYYYVKDLTTTTIGLVPGQEYAYLIVYSS